MNKLIKNPLNKYHAHKKFAYSFKEASKAFNELAKALKPFENKILMVLVFFSFNSLLAQDGYSLEASVYNDLYKNINVLDSVSTKSVADRIVKSSPAAYDFVKLKSRDNGNQLTYYYIKVSLRGEARTEALEFGCKPCLKVSFSQFKDGLKFSSVIGSSDNILPVWRSIFLKSATKDNVESSFKYREVKNRELGLDVRLTKKQHLWQIYNWSL